MPIPAYNVKIYEPTASKKRWRVVWRENGKRIDRPFPTREEAEAFRAQVIVALHAGHSAKSSQTPRTTVRKAWRRYVEDKTPEIGTGYIEQLHRFEKELAPFHILRMQDFSAQNIQAIVDTKKTPNAKKRIIEKIRPWLHWCYQTGLLTTPPTDILQAVKTKTRRTPRRGSAQTVRSFNMNEVYALVQTTHNLWKTTPYTGTFPAKARLPEFCQRTALMMLLQASTGLRIGELKALTIADVKTFPNKLLPSELTITKQYLEMPGGTREITLPKNQQTRIVTIPAWTAPTQHSETGRYRKSTEILQKFGAPESIDTWAELTKYRCQWLTKNLNYDNLIINWENSIEIIDPTVIRTLKNVTVTANNRTIPLSQFAAEDQERNPENLALWTEFFDIGQILPLREILWAYIETLYIEFSKPDRKPLWKQQPKKTENAKSGLLWPALRPPRVNTKIPTGAEKPLPWNGTWTPQQTTRDFIRNAFNAAGLYEPVVPGHTRRTMREMRHTFAINALRMGTPIPIVAQQLGHSDPAVTLTRYAKHVAWGEAQNFTL